MYMYMYVYVHVHVHMYVHVILAIFDNLESFPGGGGGAQQDSMRSGGWGKTISSVCKHTISRGSGGMLPQEVVAFWTP